MSSNNNIQPVTLTIAGFDPTSGAGITADIKTFATFNCYGLAVTTAITVQDTSKVYSYTPLKADIIKKQLEILSNDIKIDSIKIGMLASKEIVLVVVDFLKSYKPKHVVIDPVLYSTSGYLLLETEAKDLIIDSLFPLATLITPNLIEASLLAKKEVKNLSQAKVVAKKLYDSSKSAILIKGGHLTGSPVDLLYDGYIYKKFKAKRNIFSAHGTGCALSSAITANLACGDDLISSIEKAKDFITNSLKMSQTIGKGANLLDHFYRFKVS